MAEENDNSQEKTEETIRGVGSAPIPDEGQAAVGAPRTKARRNLAANIESYVIGQMKDYVARSDASGGYSEGWEEFGRLLASDTAARILQDLEEYSTWKNPAGDTLFVQYEVMKQQVRASAAELVPERVETVNPFEEEKQRGVASLTAFLKKGPEQKKSVQRTQEESGDSGDNEGSDVPNWLSQGAYTVHPWEEYVAEVGVADDRAGAEEAARRAVVETLTGRMRSEASRLSRSTERRELGSQVERLPRPLIAYRPELFAAPRITHTWFDNQSASYYALAVLEREAARDQTLTAAFSAAETGRQPLEDARRQRDAGEVGTALESYLEALMRMRSAARAVLAAFAVQHEQRDGARLEELAGNLALKETDSELRRLVDSISVRRARGNLQWVPPGESPSEPLAVRVGAGSQDSAAAGVPVEFRLEGRQDGWHELARTDTAGAVQVRSPAMDGDVGREVGVVAALEPAAMLEDVSHLDIDGPRTRFRFVLRSRDTTSLAVGVREQAVSGGRASSSVIRATLEDVLESNGFKLQDLSGLRAGDGLWLAGGELRREKLVSACRATAANTGMGAPPVAVVGTCNPRVEQATETSRGTLYFVSARVQLQVIDPAFAGSGGAKVATIAVSEQDAYTDDRAEAYRRARRKAAEKCAGDVLEELDSRLR